MITYTITVPAIPITARTVAHFFMVGVIVPFDIPVLDRIADIGLLSLYTSGATTLLSAASGTTMAGAMAGGAAHSS